MKIEYREIKDANTIRVTTSDERWYLHPKTKEWIPSSTWICAYVPSKELAIWMAKKGWDEAELIKQEAGARGSRTHKAIEILIAGGEIKHNEALTDGDGNYQELSVQEYENIISFNDWAKENKPEFLASEKTVFNEKMKYAGTLDCIAKINGVVYLIDFKTSANIYLSHEVQLSSYLHADDVKADKMAILQLGYNKNKKKFKFTEIEDKFSLFQSAYSFWNEANKNVTVKQKDFPLSIQLGI
ncbi:MAG: hypothetical protein IPJ03_22370 [Ignavibacteriales bacterium]|nr:hypothetical protein [Ignavibacteriales bacterium]